MQERYESIIGRKEDNVDLALSESGSHNMSSTGNPPEQYRLRGVVMVPEKLLYNRPASASAPVLEVDFKGLRCVGQSLNRHTDGRFDGANWDQLVAVCKCLSELSHPNIVQFLGIYYPGQEEHEGATVLPPIVVTEFLPTDLTSCINEYRKRCDIPPEQHGTLPYSICYSILYDISCALYYLHEKTPSVVHGSLYSDNILLTHDMVAKISGLYKTKILSIGCTEPHRTTGSAYDHIVHFLPQEMNQANTEGTIFSDVFSYGIIMIHVLSGQLPIPDMAALKSDSLSDLDVMGSVSTAIHEEERRLKFLKGIKMDHCLQLIKECINDHSKHRPRAKKIVGELAEKVKQYPRPSWAERLEQLRSYTCGSKGGYYYIIMYNVMYSTAHMKGKRLARFLRGAHRHRP